MLFVDKGTVTSIHCSTVACILHVDVAFMNTKMNKIYNELHVNVSEVIFSSSYFQVMMSGY